MKITRDQVEHVAHLARLQFGEEETGKFTTQLNDILLYVDMLNRIDTSDVPPMTHAIAQKNAFREDTMADSLSSAESLANAPDVRGDFFRVPRVIE